MAETSSQQPQGATASPPADDTNMDMDIDENEENGAADGGQGRILDLPTNEQVHLPLTPFVAMLTVPLDAVTVQTAKRLRSKSTN